MHMISEKDLNSSEMDSLTISCSPMIVITANGEVQTHEEAYSVCQRVGYILDNESPRKHASSIVAWKALRWKRIFLWMDQWSKTTSHQKRDSVILQFGALRSLTWFQACQRVLPPFFILQLQWHLQDLRGIVLHLLHQLRQHQVTTRLEKERIKVKLILLPVLVSSSNVDDRTEKSIVCRLRSCKLWNPLSGCKNSEKFWWMMKFQYLETLTPVLPTKYL